MILKNKDKTTINVTNVNWCRLGIKDNGIGDLLYIRVNFNGNWIDFKYSKLEDAESDIKHIQEVIYRLENPVEEGR